DNAARFFTRDADYLVQPVSQVPPFPVELEYQTEAAGQQIAPYLDRIGALRWPMRSSLGWVASCWSIPVPGGPAISVPCGFSPGGHPVGLQIVGRRGDDVGVLRLARAFED